MSYLLVTGAPGVGKTTLIKKIAQKLSTLKNVDLRGFYTEGFNFSLIFLKIVHFQNLFFKRTEVRDNAGIREGFDVGNFIYPL
jgi:adenylate kinase